MAQLAMGMLCVVYMALVTPFSIEQEYVTPWSNDRTKAKTKEETNLLTDWNTPKPQTDIDQKMDVDKLALSKLQIGQSDPKEELVDVTDVLIPPPTTKVLEETAEKNNSNELSKAEKRQQQEEEKYAVYQRMYTG